MSHVSMLSRRSVLGGLSVLPFVSVNIRQAFAISVEPVDRHVGAVIDISGSVDEEEFKLMMEGFGKGFLSENNLGQFRMGACQAWSLVFFADTAQYVATDIVKSPEDVFRFVKERIYDFEQNKPCPRLGLGSGTSILSGLRSMKSVFENEARYGVETMYRAVIVAGDGIDGSPNAALQLREIRDDMTQLNVVTSGIPIIERPWESADVLTTFYRQNIVTPPGAICRWRVSEDGPELERKVPAGMVFPARMFQEVGNAVEQALQFNIS